MEATDLPFQIPDLPVQRVVAFDADSLYALLRASEQGELAPETLVSSSSACAEILSRGTPVAMAVVEERLADVVLALRYGPEEEEIRRLVLPLHGLSLGSISNLRVALILPLEPERELAPDLEASFRERHSASTFACVIPGAIGVDPEQIQAWAQEIPPEDWRGLEVPASVHEARRGFAPRSAHPLESHEAGPLEGPSSRFVPGQVMGDYTLRSRLGRGSMGEVWRADGPTGPVAIKLALRPSFVRHLRQEGLLLAQVDHPHVARFVSADLDHDPPYLATELVAGQPLRVQCRGKLPPSNVVLLCDQLLSGLQAIHEAGILHLDLKPENVIVQPGGGLKIVDLGLGHATTRFMEEVYLSVSLVSRAPPVAGTLAYMSPEQRKGRELGPPADLFAFGILLHELLTGYLPEPGVGVSDRRPGLAPRWDVVLARLTHPDVEKRPSSAGDARLLVCYTMSEKLRRPVPRGGVRPRDVKSFDEEAFALTSPYVPAQVIGEGYELIEPLGRGGFGEVWRARRGGGEEGPEILVAVKLILTDDAREGLEQEAAVAARIQHKNVPALLGNFCHEDPPHLVFELVEGRSLRLLINEREEPFPLAEALAIFGSQVEVVQACAAAGVVHMDLKPEHFLVREESGGRPQVTLIDFGLAALLDRQGVTGSLASVDEVRGTLDYMAPEQRRGQTGPEVDVYALGVCLFELLTLSLPRGTQGIRSIQPGVPAALDALCLQMLSSNQYARPTLKAVSDLVRELRYRAPRSPRALPSDAARPGSSTLARVFRSPLFWTSLLPGLVGLYLLVAGVPTWGPEESKSSRDPHAKYLGSPTQFTAELAALGSGSRSKRALLIRGLEAPESEVVRVARARAEARPSRALAYDLVTRLLVTRNHDAELGAALVGQGALSAAALVRLRGYRPVLAVELYSQLQSGGGAWRVSLEGAVWMLTKAPPEARKRLGLYQPFVEEALNSGPPVDPRDLRESAVRLDALLAAPSGVDPDRLRLACLLRAALGPRASERVHGLEAQGPYAWALQAYAGFVAQLPSDASQGERRAVDRVRGFMER